ncbi:self-incompatibility protein S1-like [Coffea eugenioides]|uniref:self-incompatibility protein S1-like n=1 Tax=Coffea eugenioides TaxID=49369 RepID=UPI000F60B09E|nr:self-incompatibility protein S1-like [Coffea eugenioides]
MLQSSAKVHVHIQNRQGKNINLHCRSKDDDLGYHNIENGTEYSWSFRPNFWYTTLFYCAVLMDPDPVWYHFDAYRQSRDSYRCESQCSWAILKHHTLIGYNQKTGNWERFFFRSDRLL